MAITKLGAERYQVKIVGPDGRWITKVLSNLVDARAYECELKEQKYTGRLSSATTRKTTLDEYAEKWFEDFKHNASPGWRHCQRQFYKDYVSPHIGRMKLTAINTPMVVRVLNQMVALGKSEQTQLQSGDPKVKAFVAC